HPATLVKRLPDFGHPETACGAFDQPRAEARLQGRNSAAQRRLRRPQLPPRRREAAVGHHRDEEGVIIEVLGRQSSHPWNTEAQDCLSTLPSVPHSSSFTHGERFAPRLRRQKMTGKFENKVVVVTGGTSGIGLATAK